MTFSKTRGQPFRIVTDSTTSHMFADMLERKTFCSASSPATIPYAIHTIVIYLTKLVYFILNSINGPLIPTNLPI